ncbi:MAG TPA: DUF1684 domain-containing protein [Actinomycetota bacterium]|nr:DUF1684 domain-containing protein [Actinomycetota bacterium]
MPSSGRGGAGPGVSSKLELLDYRREIFSLYGRMRQAMSPEGAWEDWRLTRRRLYTQHPQSPVPPSQRASYEGPHYFPYDRTRRVLAHIEEAEPRRYELPSSTDEPFFFTRFGAAVFELDGRNHSLGLYWLDTYGGGLFLPFHDASSGTETYGAGRYLLDTVKGADLGSERGELVLDFNFSYQPSCSYDPRWGCPLAPPENRLDIAVTAGERLQA